ncbi:hypothetical protein HPULCUR_010203 [Helicostylum pulchrum]|uniref:Uncharacterized protein n=1 Tax=Helicostylum pulchrum TaxID=562976 RepID=A0ABP9YD18_9FUNG
MIHPCLLATSVYLSKACACGSYFTPGEEPSNAMHEQLVKLKSKVDHRKAYNADGVIRFNSFLDFEILLLETSDHFKNTDERKISFDNNKGLYALLAMIKTVADKFDFASADLFKKLKLYFVQASDEYISLWSIQYASNGAYVFNRERKITITEERADVKETLNGLIDFFNLVKVSYLLVNYNSKY